VYGISVEVAHFNHIFANDVALNDATLLSVWFKKFVFVLFSKS